MTYRNCKKLIEIAERKGTKTPEWIADMKEKLDIFLLNNRIVEEEYTELMRMLEPVAEETPVGAK